MAIENETALTLFLIAGVVVAFVVLHLSLRTVPWTEAVPREQYRWPVWNWYALVVGFGIISMLVANLYWNARIEEHDPHDTGFDIQRTRGTDEPGEEKGNRPRSQLAPERILVTGAESAPEGPAIVQASPTPPVPDPLATPTPEPMTTPTPPVPDPLASPTATATPITTPAPLPTATPEETPTPQPVVSPLGE